MLRRAVEDHRGSGRSATGAFVAVFDSASDAVYCAVSAQSWLDGRAALRVGIHIGDVEIGDAEISAQALSEVKHIAHSAEPGAIRVSQAVYDMVKARPEIRVAHLGEDGFEVLTGDKTSRGTQGNLRRARLWTALAGAAVVAVAGSLVWRERFAGRGSQRSLYTIALLPFSATSDSSEANVMWNLVKDKLDEEVGRDPDVLVLAYQHHGMPRSEAEARAEGLRLKADMVIWGEVVSLKRETEIKPHITMLGGPASKGQPGTLHASLDEPDQITLHEQKADELGNLVLLAVAKYYHRKQDFTKALSLLKKIDPPGASSLIEESLVLYSMGRWEEMGERLDKIHNPSLYARRMKAWNRFILGDTRRAIAELEEVHQADPKNAKTYQMLDNFYFDLGGEKNLKQALAFNEEAEKLDPNNVLIHSDRGAIYYQQGRFKEAASEFDRLAQKSPVNVFARFFCYTSLRRAGEIVKAQAYLQDLLRHFPSIDVDPAEPWDLLLADYLAGRISDRDLLAGTASDDPTIRKERESSAYFYLGRAAEEKGDRDLARFYFQKSRATERRNFYQHSLSAFELSQLGTAKS